MRRKRGTPETIAAGLRADMLTVYDSYRRFLAAGPTPSTGDDDKAFAAFHNACRAALAHLEQLVDLADSKGCGDVAAEGAALLAQARQDLAALEDSDESGDDDGGAA